MQTVLSEHKHSLGTQQEPEMVETFFIILSIFNYWREKAKYEIITKNFNEISIYIWSL